jgi:hypothetical protein
MLKARFPEKSVELMIVANRIPRERFLACQRHDIEAREISQKQFRDVAEEVGYVFKSEAVDKSAREPIVRPLSDPVKPEWTAKSADEDFATVPSKVEKEWHYWEGKHGRGYFLAFVNARGSCSMRRFDAEDGASFGKEYKSGDYQNGFADYLKCSVPLHVGRQPNLERDCKSRLPLSTLSEPQAADPTEVKVITRFMWRTQRSQSCKNSPHSRFPRTYLA